MSDNVRAGCPVDEWASDGPRRAPLEHFERIDALRNRNRPFFWTTTAQGYFVFTDHDAIVEGLQNATLFSSSAVVPEMPDPPYRWIPQMLDPPEHGKWRHLLAGYFSPPTVRRMEAEQRAFAARLIDEVAAKGSADYVADFAHTFPTTIFLQIMGAPTDMLPTFLEWEAGIFRRTEGGDQAGAAEAMGKVMQYFGGLIAERRVVRAHGPPSDGMNDAIFSYHTGVCRSPGAVWWNPAMGNRIEITRDIAASPEAVYAAISDITRMGEWSDECYACEWHESFDGPEVGATFDGHNRNGEHEWTSQGKVIEAEPGRAFAFECSMMDFHYSTWGYRIEPIEGGSRVTEWTEDLRPDSVLEFSKQMSGVEDRTAKNEAMMSTTLERLAAALEG